jgi:hypothetical protein
MLIGLGSITNVAATIQRIEGWYPGSLSYRNNNPGNLRCQPSGVPFSYQTRNGATGCDSGNFAVFSSSDGGSQALNDQIDIDASAGLSIADFTKKYAPAQDGNDPASYAAQIAAASGVSVSDPLSSALLDGSSSPVISTDSTGLSTDQPVSTSVLLLGAAALALVGLVVATR